MQHLRRMMLVHCCVYYQLGDSLVSDHQWYAWAQELVHFQAVFGADIGFYDNQFRDWEGFTGFHLRYDADIVRAAQRLLAYRDAPPVTLDNCASVAKLLKPSRRLYSK